MIPTTLTIGGVTVSLDVSAGADGAVIVFIDTTYEPDGSDGGPGLRVMLNDDPIYTGVPFDVPREAA